MGVTRVRQALIALKPVERERVGGYARYCLKFQRDDLAAEVKDTSFAYCRVYFLFIPLDEYLAFFFILLLFPLLS